MSKDQLTNNIRRLRFDERELHLIRRSASCGHITFVAFAGLAMYIPFYLIGGQGLVPMWSIPIAFFSGLFLSGLVEFIFLLYQIKEDEKITEEGGAV